MESTKKFSFNFELFERIVSASVVVLHEKSENLLRCVSIASCLLRIIPTNLKNLERRSVLMDSSRRFLIYSVNHLFFSHHDAKKVKICIAT